MRRAIAVAVFVAAVAALAGGLLPRGRPVSLRHGHDVWLHRLPPRLAAISGRASLLGTPREILINWASCPKIRRSRACSDIGRFPGSCIFSDLRRRKWRGVLPHTGSANQSALP
jgi:hypothetical protein